MIRFVLNLKPFFILGKKTISKDDANIENPEVSNSDPYDSPKIEPKKNDSNTDPYDSPVSPKKGPNKNDLSKLTVKDQAQNSDSNDGTISEISTVTEDEDNEQSADNNKK